MKSGDEVDLVPAPVHTAHDFTAFFYAEQARLLKALYFVTGNREEAADITQDAFVKLWDRGELGFVP